MNAMTNSSELSVYNNKINSATIFYSFLHDAETALRKVINKIFMMAEIGQRSMTNFQNNNDSTMLKAKEK